VKGLLMLAARYPWMAAAVSALVLTVGGLLFAASGVLPLKASSGHWAITEWLLHFSMRRSVKTHALLVSAPPLDDPSLVMRGAAHFDLGCRPCHGSPAGARPEVARAMLPPPPELSPRIQGWTASELFYIVKHGVKFTGMPAWPSQQRDDEVWAVVAFLRQLPDLGDREYLALARAAPETTLELGAEGESVPELIRESCARCHGIDGLGRGGGGFPKLAGQRLEYMTRALFAYLEGRRHSGVMKSVVAGLTPDTIAETAAYFSALPVPPATEDPETSDDLARGRVIATQGRPERDVPACIECHGPAAMPKNPAYPILSAQYSDYLALQLRLLQGRQRGGSEFLPLMHEFVDRLSDDDIRDVSAYFAALEPMSIIR
jgi:cytochrome c553